MQNLLQNVRQRYGTGMNFHNLFTLSHRVRPKAAKPKFETANLERGILRTVNSDMMRHIEQWKQQSARAEKKRVELDKRIKRQNDLIFANLSIQIKRIKRELAALRALENERREESEFVQAKISSLTGGNTKRLFEKRAEEAGGEIRSEIAGAAKKAVRIALRQMREEEDYKRRRGR